MENKVQEDKQGPTLEEFKGIALKTLGGRVYGGKIPGFNEYFSSFLIGSLLNGPIATINPSNKEVVYYKTKHKNKIDNLLEKYNEITPNSHWASIPPK